MTNLSVADISTLLAGHPLSFTGKDIVTTKMLKSIHIEHNKLYLTCQFGFPIVAVQADIERELSALINTHYPELKLIFDCQTNIVSHAVQQGIKSIKGIKNIIAVASGKGGVGKSTTAVNLALALQQQGASVGILDADIYGPSQPHLLGLAGKQPESLDGKHLQPLVAHGIQSMSIGYLVDVSTPMIWRGPMVSSALQQLLHDTSWQEIDYLIVDLPPGTGDIQLTLSQKIPVSAAVVVTTPQDIALLDVRKSIGMFNKVNVPVLGVIENMSMHYCSACGHAEPIFGHGGAAKLVEEYGVSLLGELPLALSIREQADAGKPTVVAEPDSAISKAYHEIATKMVAKLSLQSVNYAAKFPNIVVEHS